MKSNTNKYYEENAVEYFNRTITVDVSHLYSQFLALIPPGGRILDAGCGSGRDLLAFHKQGYEVIGIDSSASLANMAEKYSGVKVIVGHLEELSMQSQFDGIWACASLLHAQRNFLPVILQNLRNALVPGGILFASVRQGSGTRTGEDGRFYTFYENEEFVQVITDAGLVIESSWKTEDVIPGREDLCWLNILARRPLQVEI